MNRDNKWIQQLLDEPMAGGEPLDLKKTDAEIEAEEDALLRASDVRVKYGGIFDSITGWQEFKDKVNSLEPLETKILRWRRTFRLAVASILVIGFTTSIYFYYSKLATGWDDRLVNTDVSPGGNRATLTLANGISIDLREGKNGIVIGGDSILYSDGSTVTADESFSGKQASSQVLVLTTPKGGQYQVSLSDGTKVWLNAGSTLRYPTRFDGKSRKVQLVGEAYFEVAKTRSEKGSQSLVPFVVESAGQEVTVLGTHFNVNAYPEPGEIRTTLIEGSVQVSVVAEGSNPGTVVNKVILNPNEQSIVSGSFLKVEAVDAEYSMAWKNGVFMFNYEKIEDIMTEISRWYDIDVVYEDKEIKQITLFGTISKFENISKVLDMFERTGVVKFQLKDKILTVQSTVSKTRK
ncbi:MULTISPECIES: FecR family protein [Sphingobacterium]|uniref:FecR family protein n=1 Tax=Sphingobacterium TaxID=28453 RepID=UPI0013DBCCAE|nr:MULTISPECIES: FecR domain-containing protein [unclassified Sphingobacterium]